MSTAHSKPSRSRKPNRSGQNDPSHGNDAGGHNGGRQAPKARQKGGAKGGSRGGSKGAPGLWLFGKHAVMAALANRERTIHRLVVAPDIAEALSAPGALREGCPKPEPQPRDRINALLSADALHQGFAAQVAPLEPPHLDQVAHDAPEDAVFMLLDGITDERNVGAILRSAAAFSVSGVIVQDRRAPEESGPLAKTACGALETVPLIRVPNLSRALEDMQKLGYWCLGLDGDGEHSLATAKPDGRMVLVLGSEGDGMRRLVRETCDQIARIPMPGDMESLNVSATAAIALYEVVARRR